MEKEITVRDVVKGNADLTEVRFRIVLAMLRADKNLAKRLKAYLETTVK
jgi:hypothetical protein